ncbi:MAG: hypothetical protein EU536_03410 [Promethearchaeota archaeon]|nr:MAG: hypothetical protein EU536_03410 [Candidatus Lokiarchaeota archaeon]
MTVKNLDNFIDPFLEVKIQKVLRYLPCSDCGDCGLVDCFAFAKALIDDHSSICPHYSPLEHELIFILLNYEEFLYPLVRRFMKSKHVSPSVMVGRIKVGFPTHNAPIILTSNSMYEQSILNLILDKGHISCYLLALETHGKSLGEVLLKQQLSIYSIDNALSHAHLAEFVDHKYIIIPRFGLYLKKAFEKISAWKFFPGPTHISELPIFLERNWYGQFLRLKSAELERVLRLMPELNCGACGFTTCRDFILDLQQHKKSVDACSVLLSPPYQYLRAWLQNRFQPIQKYETGISIDSHHCNGCGICSKVCPANAAFLGSSRLHEIRPLFTIVNGTAQIINYQECWRHKYLIPCQVCQNNCPYGAISFGAVPIYCEPTHSVSRIPQE